MKLKKALEMASLLLIIICVYLTLNSYVETSVVVSEDQYGNPDWKMAMKQIEELQKIVKNMDDYRKIVKRQNGRIAQLESRVRFLEAIVRLEENGPVDLQTHEKGIEFNGTNAISKGSLKRKGVSSIFISVFLIKCYLYYSYYLDKTINTLFFD